MELHANGSKGEGEHWLAVRWRVEDSVRGAGWNGIQVNSNNKRNKVGGGQLQANAKKGNMEVKWTVRLKHESWVSDTLQVLLDRDFVTLG